MSVTSTLQTLDVNPLPGESGWPLIQFTTHESGAETFVTASISMRVGRGLGVVDYTAPGRCVREALHNLAKILEAVGETLAALYIREEESQDFKDLAKRAMALSFREEEELELTL